MKHIALLFPAILALVLVSCGPNQHLTRSEAKKIMDAVAAKSEVTQITLIPGAAVSPEQEQRLKAQAATIVSLVKGARPCLPDPSDVRIATGQFAFCEGVSPGVTWQRPGLLVTLNKPTTWSLVEVTGIADGQNANEKVVEYTWEYNFSQFPGKIPEVFKQAPRPGKALLRLYDDGWRFVKFQ
jgi:hypothetical protein